MARQTGTTTAPVRTSAPSQPGRKPMSADSGPNAPSRPQNAPNAVLNSDAVRQRAYEIFLSRGQTEGSALEDWLQAERELRAKSTTRRA